MVHEANHIIHHFDSILFGIVGFIAFAVPAAVHCDDLMIAGQIADDRSPDLNAGGKWMYEDDRLPISGDGVSNLDAVRIGGLIRGLGVAGSEKDQANDKQDDALSHELPPDTWSFFA